MNLLAPLLVIAFAGLIHASFQLSVSVLTLLSSHTIGTKASQAKLLRLTNSFVLGALIMTLLLLSVFTLFAGNIFHHTVPPIMWAVCCGLLLGLGVAVWIFYYRKEQGTTLWLPRSLARFLTDRTKATKHSAESFSLGMTSVFAELLFILAPLVAAALTLVTLPSHWQLVGIALYLAVSLSSLALVSGLIGSGHKLSRIQKWRETNKRFQQFAAGSGLIILGLYLYVNQVIAVTVLAPGAM
jgi:hypothetical protein